MEPQNCRLFFEKASLSRVIFTLLYNMKDFRTIESINSLILILFQKAGVNLIKCWFYKWAENVN
jgi:hypothetical protein